MLPADIRTEQPADIARVAVLIAEAFATAPHSLGKEAEIVDGLRRAGELVVSLVAEDEGRVVGHIAFSPVTIWGANCGWYGLGPVAVHPAHQGKGVGSELIEAGLARLLAIRAKGCVLLGEPGYYERFGFRPDPRLVLPGVPPEYFLALRFSDDEAEGEVAYHPAFGA